LLDRLKTTFVVTTRLTQSRATQPDNETNSQTPTTVRLKKSCGSNTRIFRSFAANQGMWTALQRLMLFRRSFTVGLCFGTGSLLLLNAALASAADDGWKEQLELLRQQNAALQETVRKQEGVIKNLNRRVSEIENVANQSSDSNRLSSSSKPDRAGVNFGRLNISGSGAVALFESERNGAFPNSEFRVDEAKLFVEAPIWDDVYFFSELNLAARTSDDLELTLGELYLDFENVSKVWDAERQLNIRVGRMDVPFGEEYLYRDAIDNPLISHSLADFWGVDEGIECYGALGKVSYVIAVQNGGVEGARDFNADKSVAARLSFDPSKLLHVSLSAMRTGDLNVTDDRFSELWFGGGWFRSIGSPSTTEFHANLVQGDLALNFSRGHLRAAGGFARYDDNDPLGENRRDFYFYSVEAVCELTGKLYAGARFSQIFVDGGYPLPGQGDMGNYFFNPFGPSAEQLWRASFGLGYRFSPHLIVKTEYSLESGEEIGGARREDVNLFSAEAAFGF
jgi:hypothetical protein